MSSPEHISLSQLQALIKARLDEVFPLPLWVAAEISEVKPNHSGHCYLELVEKGGENHLPRARCNAVIWRSTYGMLSSCFAAATGGGELEAGMKVLLKVMVIYHELYGLSLQVTDIDPAYTLGDMERQRQETIRRLQQEGVYDMNRELEIPPVVQRVAIISSRNAAGFQDFVNELGASPYAFQVTLFEAFMQGRGAENSIIEALEQVMENVEQFDVLAVIRGGGSVSDLACFDAYRLASHLAQFPLPIVTGIGHDKDQSVADLVASVALKTPTAVAGWLSDSLAQFDNRLDEIRNEVALRAEEVLNAGHTTLRQHGFALSQMATRFSYTMKLRLERLSGEIRRRCDGLFLARHAALGNLSEKVPVACRAVLQRETNRLARFDSLAGSRTHEKILALGFSIVRYKGIAVKRSCDLAPGQTVDITLHEGHSQATIQ